MNPSVAEVPFANTQKRRSCSGAHSWLLEDTKNPAEVGNCATPRGEGGGGGGECRGVLRAVSAHACSLRPAFAPVGRGHLSGSHTGSVQCGANNPPQGVMPVLRLAETINRCSSRGSGCKKKDCAASWQHGHAPQRRRRAQ
jgi:hypothetical protein